jgi:hypothetical protein
MTDQEIVQAFREKARVLYAGKRVAHRSCGIAIAETFDLATPSYQALRRGGLTGEGACGAILAGQLVLGELLGDPDPTGPATPQLRAALVRYRAEVARRLGGNAAPVCNDLVAPFADFAGPERMGFCTGIAATVAEIVAEIALELGAQIAPSANPQE